LHAETVPADPTETLSTPRETGQGGLSVADLCRRWKVGPDKIHGFIRSGELLAVNVASTLAGRPRWRIMPDAVTQFEQRRSSTPLPKPPRRRRRQEAIDFYP
jgi:hypothetical protein